MLALRLSAESIKKRLAAILLFSKSIIAVRCNRHYALLRSGVYAVPFMLEGIVRYLLLEHYYASME